ncbi:hypothetical protein POM88_041162 [Heracleum sosnowskyi]|uniref:Transposase Tnp1/En/Spm-like domain-containing protein n=1 Tax=Heracleum sosnowskyi TaxID=360622 RepID=A0AAD8HEH8_9APIA|nr:hypothetical protein POM88_041162 [Heracleum sosnowskyi]
MADYLMDIEAQIKDGLIKIGPDEDALTVGTPISGNGSRDSCINVTIPASKEFLTPVKSVEKQVTPTADTSIMAQKGAAFLPYETGDMRTVEDALGSFVAWPKNLIKIIDHQVPNPTANGKGEEHSADQVKKEKKRCNTITGSPVTRSKAKANKADKLRKKRKLVV